LGRERDQFVRVLGSVSPVAIGNRPWDAGVGRNWHRSWLRDAGLHLRDVRDVGCGLAYIGSALLRLPSSAETSPRARAPTSSVTEPAPPGPRNAARATTPPGAPRMRPPYDLLLLRILPLNLLVIVAPTIAVIYGFLPAQPYVTVAAALLVVSLVFAALAYRAARRGVPPDKRS
jgi:hypothetical protein